MHAEFHNLKTGAMPGVFKRLVPAINRHYSVLIMYVICPSCHWSSSSAPKRVLITGACPTCSGQIWLAQPSQSEVMPSVVAMSFEAGSNLAKPLLAFHRETHLGTEGSAEQVVPQAVAEESRELLSASILPAPPVVEGQDASATGVFKLPEMPSFQFEDDESSEEELLVDVDLEDVHVEVGESSFTPLAAEEVQLDISELQLVEAPPVANAAKQSRSDDESWLTKVPLPDLPAFDQAEVRADSYDDFVEFNQEPMLVNQTGPSWLLSFAIVGLACALVLTAYIYGSSIAQWQVEDLVIPPPSRVEMAQDVRARALTALSENETEAAMALMKEYRVLEPQDFEAFRVMGVIALRQGDRALALRLYRSYLEKVPPRSDKANGVSQLLQDAARFVALKDANEVIDSEVETDWSLVATQLVNHTSEK